MRPELHNTFKVNEVELIYRNPVKQRDRIKVASSSRAFELLRSNWDENKIELVEQFKVLLLSRSNACLGISTIATGGTSLCPVDPKILFSTALKAHASAMILAHNHPSGNLVPSPEDIRITVKLVEGAKLLDLSILDHLIVTTDDYTSLADENLMPR